MEYNTERDDLMISEYGRNVQKMIEHTIKLEDRNERNIAAQTIVKVMAQLNPQFKEYDDFNHMLWDHLFIMSDFKLDVDSPFERPEKDSIAAKPENVKYPGNSIKYKHYGRTIQQIIDKLSEMEEGDQKQVTLEALANFMKMSYLSWNRDTVNDELIIEQITELSRGKLKLDENFKFSQTHDLIQQSNKGKQQQNVPVRKRSKQIRRKKR